MERYREAWASFGSVGSCVDRNTEASGPRKIMQNNQNFVKIDKQFDFIDTSWVSFSLVVSLSLSFYINGPYFCGQF